MGAASSVLERRHSTYAGHVQGVGFRYTTRSIARGYEVFGYVRNLPTGDVEVLAEGSPEQLDQFLQELEDRMAGNIRQSQHDRRPATYEFANFDIRY